MKLRNWCRDNFGMHTIRKRVFFLSKLAGGAIVLFYLFTSVLPVGQDAAFLIWFLLMLGGDPAGGLPAGSFYHQAGG